MSIHTKARLTGAQRGSTVSHAIAALARDGGPVHAMPTGSRARTCQFPLWGDEPGAAANGKYCGKPIMHRSYCQIHFALCYRLEHMKRLAVLFAQSRRGTP
ncbi:hypothetical protein LCGC14_2273460 [marine sediment metagenome]|uniref:Uncharacterized protein n=1 Tax=marine sediment metagenome TaxID=412755 RepID=A0A0F9FRD4_9ZZZZ